MTNLEIYASDRLVKVYRKGIFSLQNMVEGAVRDFANRHSSDPSTLLHNYDRHALLSNQVIEMDLSGGHRLLARYDRNRLLLLDMGEHEVVRRYDANKLKTDLINNVPAPREFWPGDGSAFFVRQPDKAIPFHYPQEVSPEWMYFLEREQEAAFNDIAVSILDREHKSHLLLGGPGTGKTCILLNLLKLLAGEYSVGLDISDELRDYLEAATSFSIADYCVNYLDLPDLEILLVDDPENIRDALRPLDSNNSLSIVVAFDPLQMPDDLTDNELAGIVRDFNPQQHFLSKCYRQKRNVGRTTKHVIDTVAASTPFLADSKINEYREERAYITKLSNDMTFVNPSGYTEFYREATVGDLQKEVNRILNNEWLMWKHWPGLLVLLDEYELSEDVEAALNPLTSRGYVRVLPLNQVEEVKGLEFQEVFIFMDQINFDEIQNGFTGSGRSTYRRRNLLRIPFSRAKDGVVTFAFEDDDDYHDL